MELEFDDLEGRHIRLEPFEAHLKEEVRAAIDCDPEIWDIMPINPTGASFESFWAVACGAPVDVRMPYAIRRREDARVVGMSLLHVPVRSGRSRNRHYVSSPRRTRRCYQL